MIVEMQKMPKNKRIPRRLKKLVIDACKRHAWNIGVSNYAADILYMSEDEKRLDGNCTLASIVVDRRYLHATVKIYPEALRKWRTEGDQAMERIIAHEIAHCATQHLYDIATARYCDDGEMKDAWEALTEIVGRLSVKLDESSRPN